MRAMCSSNLKKYVLKVKDTFKLMANFHLTEKSSSFCVVFHLFIKEKQAFTFKLCDWRYSLDRAECFNSQIS